MEVPTPLRDHFQPPLSLDRDWGSFLAAWPTFITQHLNHGVLPAGYFALPYAKRELLSDPDRFEVQVKCRKGETQLVTAVELLSPRNKDRPAARKSFAMKCASYLREGVCVILVDIVTEVSGDLRDELLECLSIGPVEPQLDYPDRLYAAAYRPAHKNEGIVLHVWPAELSLGSELPTLPLWLAPDLCVPLNLETTYQVTCKSLLIP